MNGEARVYLYLSRYFYIHTVSEKLDIARAVVSHHRQTAGPNTYRRAAVPVLVQNSSSHFSKVVGNNKEQYNMFVNEDDHFQEN